MRRTLRELCSNSRDRGASTRQATWVSIGLAGIFLLLTLVLSGLLSGRSLFPIVGRSDADADESRRRTVPVMPTSATPEDEMLVTSVGLMFDDMQATWARLFSTIGQRYVAAQMVLFRDAVQSACGHTQPATGSFYCPLDQKVYVDLGVCLELRARDGATGDLGQRYVLAHEIGHHVQTLLGIEQRIHQLRAEQPAAVDPLSVRLELQADCLAGVWWRSGAERGSAEQALKQALNTAAAGGADRGNLSSQDERSPEALTHGSAAERAGWFRRGLESGRIAACDRVAEAT